MRASWNSLLSERHGLHGGFGASSDDSPGARDRRWPAPQHDDILFSTRLSCATRGTAEKAGPIPVAAPLRPRPVSPRAHSIVRLRRVCPTRGVLSSLRSTAGPPRWPSSHAPLRQRASSGTATLRSACPSKLLVPARREKLVQPSLPPSRGSHAGPSPPSRRLLLLSLATRPV